MLLLFMAVALSCVMAVVRAGTVLVARTHAQGRIVSCLEGGYNLSALARSVAAHLKVLMEA